ncbi:MAG: hypothetical protein RL497_2776, partial [Pseudomonadota bacterium]
PGREDRAVLVGTAWRVVLTALFHKPLKLRAFIWRRDPESNRAKRSCNPEHNRFAIAPFEGAHSTQFVRKKQPSGKICYMPVRLFNLEASSGT